MTKRLYGCFGSGLNDRIERSADARPVNRGTFTHRENRGTVIARGLETARFDGDVTSYTLFDDDTFIILSSFLPSPSLSFSFQKQ